jgi:hypothetical protein
VVEADAEVGGLAATVDAGEEFLGVEGAVVGVARFLAVIAGGAIFEREGFAEVGEEFAAAAGGSFGVAGHEAELVAGALLLGGVSDLVEEVVLFGDVAAAEEQEAIAGEAIAAGAASLLVIAFDVFGEIVVDDPANVGFVNAHAEGDGGADDFGLVAEEEFLVTGTFGGFEPGVVRFGGVTAASEGFGDAFGGGAGGAVDDAGLVFAAFYPVDDLFEGLVLGEDFVGEVGPVKGGDEEGGGAEAEVFNDVGADAVGRGGGEGDEGDFGEEVAELGDLAVFGAKIVAPLGDAVGFIDGQTSDVPGAEVFLPVIEHEALRSDVEQAVFAAVEAGEAGAGGGRIEGGIQEGGGDTGSLHLIDLIFHQSDEGRDDDGEPAAVQSGELETHRLAAPGGEEGKHITASEGGFDDFALERAELFVTEGGAQGVKEFFERWHGAGGKLFTSATTSPSSKREVRTRRK